MCESSISNDLPQETLQMRETAYEAEDVSRALENEKTLNLLLRALVQPKELPEIALDCLDTLLSVSWLSILPKGGFFLANPANNELTLIAERNLSPELITLCARIPFGRCLCGKAAAEGKLLHSACVDGRHEISFKGMGAHGHYNVPILAEGSVLGVLVFYLPHGHERNDAEVRFLRSCADILSLVIRQKMLEKDLHNAIVELRRLAQIDPLTELYNRRFLMDRLESEISKTERLGQSLSVLLIDVDLFKNINDTHGHDIGDAVLVEIGRNLIQGARNHDIVGRLGGEEFCIVLPEADAKHALGVAERIRSLIEASEVGGGKGKKIKATVSIGLADCRPQETAKSLLIRADNALYAAKSAGRNRVEICTAAHPCPESTRLRANMSH